MPSKPAKCGIKVWLICDAANGFPLKGIIYTGKMGNTRDINQGERVVKELAIGFKGSGRNISMDRFFTTLPLDKGLLSWNLTIVGTLKKDKPYIPQEMKASKTRQPLSTLFGFHDKVTICSYVPKKNKATLHDDAKTSDEAHKKLAFFNNILDIFSLAAYIIYYENNKMMKKKTNQRILFLRQLAEELAVPLIEERVLNQQIMPHQSTKLAIESYFNKPITVQFTTDNQPRDNTGRKFVVGSCYICTKQPIRKRRKTRKCCVQWEKPVCDENTAKITKCVECRH